MGEKQKYGIDFKLQVVRKYEQGKCGYNNECIQQKLGWKTPSELPA